MSESETQPALGAMLSERQKMLLLLSLGLCMFMSSLDGSIVSTALPQILSDLGGFSLLSWVFTIYMLCSTVVVPIVGKLSDQFGRRPFVITGVLIFLAGSLACGLATTMPMLIAARGIQGLGGGMILACVLTVMADLYTPIERAKYVGYVLGIITVGTLIGPTVGGFLTDGPGWRWCFYINLPVGAVAMFFMWVNLPNIKRGGARIWDIDFAGAALLTTATIALLLALVWAQERFGWGSGQTLGLLIATLVFAVTFVWQELRHPQPIIPMSLFRNDMYVLTGLIVLLSSALVFAAISYLPTFLQTSLGASATTSGLISTPQALGVLAMSILGGRLIAKTGKYKYQIVVGSALSAISAYLLHTLGVGDPKWHVAAFMVVFGLGSGLVTPVMNVVVQSAVPQAMTGVATSSQMFFRQIAGVLGVALFGVLFTTTYSSSFRDELGKSGTAVPEGVVASFSRDATLALDPVRLRAVEDDLAAAGGGAVEFEAARSAQREAVASATSLLFLVSAIGGVIVVALGLMLRQIPLRGRVPARSHAPERESSPADRTPVPSEP
ncbi:MAG: MDR family MFS transporter [Dehalococcoidia bacterium]